MAESRSNGEGTGVIGSAKTEDALYSTGDSSAADGRLGDGAAEVLGKGAFVGRYLVLDRLGEGAMGVVYAAYDPELDRKIALKLLRPHSGKGDKARRQARLVREAKAIAKLSHPNVVGIFDVGVHDGQVFLAMEFLGGGTLREWITAKKRPWRDVVKMFIEVGKGLAGAHAEGLIHRDFKPDNVLLDKNGVPKVVDFGLVRLNSAALDRSTTGSIDLRAAPDVDDDEANSLPVAQTALAALTRTGALAGTPAYMAPEQFLAKPIDARTDQFAFCVALYEALYGERPFAGDTVIAIADAVTEGRLRAASAKGVDIPSWVRLKVVRGLRVNPDERYASFDDLLAVLATDPVARLRRRLAIAAAALVVVGGAVATRHVVSSRHLVIERQVAEHARLAEAALADAAAKQAEAKTLRASAFAAFDGFERDRGEELWARSLAAAAAADAGFERGIQRLEAAITLDPRRDLKDRIADALVAFIQMDGRTPGEREVSLKRLAPHDEGGRRSRRLSAPATLRIETTPPGFAATIEPYDSRTHQVTAPPRHVGHTPISLSLEPGSYRLSFAETSTHAGFHYPVLLAAGENHFAPVRVPPRSAVPKDFVYVPEGRFLFGSDDEEIRAIFFETIPLHTVTTGAFFIARHETTIADWLSFVDTLPARERELRRPHGGRDALGGFIDVRRSQAETWEVRFRATDRNYRARQGEPFRYEDRDRRAALDWSRFPVTGVSAEDALAYVAWLQRSGRVPGARLCTEREWERAARGADSRRFPHGDKLLPDDANFDLTYGRKNGAYGPDEAGSHPASASPFGIHDLVGNAWEMTASVLDRNQYVARGSSFYMCLKTLLSANRDPISSVTRDYTIGLRICADPRY